MGEDLAAGKSRKTIAILEKESKEDNGVQRPVTPKSVESRNRKVCENESLIGTEVRCWL